MKVKVKSGVYFKKPLMQCLKGERRGNDKEGKEQMGWGGVESMLEGRMYQKETRKREEHSSNRTRSVTEHRTKRRRAC